MKDSKTIAQPAGLLAYKCWHDLGEQFDETDLAGGFVVSAMTATDAAERFVAQLMSAADDFVVIVNGPLGNWYRINVEMRWCAVRTAVIERQELLDP